MANHAGTSGKRGFPTSTRQRVVVLTFATPDEADEWDRAGQPLAIPADVEVEPWHE